MLMPSLWVWRVLLQRRAAALTQEDIQAAPSCRKLVNKAVTDTVLLAIESSISGG